jgi:superfamily II DNA helicase RecQ
MAFKFFAIPIRNADAAAAEMNGFLRAHKVLSIDRRWVDGGADSLWLFCIDYLDSLSAGGSDKNGSGSRSKVDYKDILRPEEFAVFSQLRQLRKEISQREAVPVYTVFTNEQLAQMVQTRAATKAALEKIAGVGDARIEKYGPRILEFLQTQWAAGHEADREPVSADRRPG